MIGGFTQMTYAQVLAFPPGTKITVHNLSKTTEHTFNVVGKTTKVAGQVPRETAVVHSQRRQVRSSLVSLAARSNQENRSRSRSQKRGTYLIECAFHYKEGMRDVLIVEKKAKPGPQGTPIPKQTSNPTPTPGGGGSGW